MSSIPANQRARGHAAPDAAALLSYANIGELLNCSPRHVRRLVERDLMPAPIKLGQLARFNRAEIQDWISKGCKPFGTGKAVRP